MGRRQPIVIAGGGIGGLTAALALAATGWRVVVAERAPEISDAGAGIQIAPNAGRVLADLGLDEAVAAQAIEPDAIDFRHGTGGHLIVSIPAVAFRKRYDFPYRVIHRADLHAILVSAVQAHPAITFGLGAFIAALRPEEDGIMVRVAMNGAVDGIDAAAFIAADGVRSTFREKVAGSAQGAVPSGRTAWRATVLADAVPDIASSPRVGVWLGRDAHVVHYPVGKGSAVNIVAIVEEPWSGGDWSTPGDPALLRQKFTQWAEPLQALLAVPASWRKFAIASVDPGAAWTDGRVALLGDAAHAMLPFMAQGAAMAIEDAVVLAAHLDRKTDVPAGLTAYERDRKRRVGRVAAAAERTGRRYHAGSLAAAVRDLALRTAGDRLILDGNDWLYRWRPPDGLRLMTPMTRSAQ